MVPTRGRSTKKCLREESYFPFGWPQNHSKIQHQSVRTCRNMGKRKSEWLLHHHKAFRECMVHTAEATFAFKTTTKVPVANNTSSPLLLWLHQRVRLNHQNHGNWQVLQTPSNNQKSTHGGCYLIKSDRSSVAFYGVRPIVTHYGHISILAAVP